MKKFTDKIWSWLSEDVEGMVGEYYINTNRFSLVLMGLASIIMSLLINLILNNKNIL